MTEEDIKHFLVIYDSRTAKTEVREFGIDYDAAMAAYAEAEGTTLDHSDVDVVLLSADSIETIKRTHSSYFQEEVASLESLLPPGVLASR